MSLTDLARGLAGGALIGISASLMLMLNGRIAGISGIVGGLLRPSPDEVAWRAWFLAGLLVGGVALFTVQPALFGATPVPSPVVALAGLLVGFGTRLGDGCTSGHGICGVSRLSRRSLVATGTFVVCASISTYVVQHVLLRGAAP